MAFQVIQTFSFKNNILKWLLTSMCYSDIFRDRSKTNIMLLFYVSWSSQTLRWRFIGNEYIPSSANMVCVWLAVQSARQEVISGLLWIHLTHDDVMAWKLFHIAGLRCEGNPPMADIFPAQMDTKVKLRCFLYCWSEQADIKIIELLMFWHAMMLLLRHCSAVTVPQRRDHHCARCSHKMSSYCMQ